MIGVLAVIGLFLTQLVLIVFLFARTLVVPLTLLVVEPTQLARRFLRRFRGSSGKALLDIDVDAKDLERILNGWQATTFAIVLCVIAFVLERHVAYLMLAVAFALPRLTASSEPVDERSFERFSRTLGAVSDAVIVGGLFLALIFRPRLDAFGLLAFVFLAREVLLVIARRWLDSEPEFITDDLLEHDSTDPKITVKVKRDDFAVGVFSTDTGEPGDAGSLGPQQGAQKADSGAKEPPETPGADLKDAT